MKKKKHKPERKFPVLIAPSVARDLVTVLEKFSIHKMDLLQYGQKDQATRLMKLNLFRMDVAEGMRKIENRKK